MHACKPIKLIIMYSIKNLKFLFTTCFVCLSFAINAQEFNFGAKAGINISSISFGDADYTTSSVIGVHLGAFGNYTINDDIALQPELLFLTGGNTWKAGSTEGKIKTSHISIPVFLQYNISDVFYLEAGPQYNFLLSIKQSINDGDFNDIERFYKSGTLGLGIGAGYDLSSLTPGLKASLRYSRDLSRMNDKDVDADNLKGSMVQLGVTYTFGK